MIIAGSTLLWLGSLLCAFFAGWAVSNRVDSEPPASYKHAIDKWTESQVATNDWFRHPRFRQFGKFVLMRPADPKQAGLLISVAANPPFPLITVWDDAKSGRPEGIMLHDAAGNAIGGTDKNGDGVFDRIVLLTTNGIYKDEGLTGTWHFRKAGKQ